jgi:hypothetical protein
VLYLEVTILGETTTGVIIGPFLSQKKLENFRREWKEVFKNHEIYTRVFNKRPKRKIYSVAYGQFALNITKIFKDAKDNL